MGLLWVCLIFPSVLRPLRDHTAVKKDNDKNLSPQMIPFHSLLLIASVLAQPSGLLFHRTALPIPCTDGTPSAFYYRNCSANWDSKGTDYCPKGGIADPVTWIILFPSEDITYLINATSAQEPSVAPNTTAGAFCYSTESCSARAKLYPQLTHTHHLPATIFPGGLLSPYAEVNPSLYKSPMVVVPYCSSDLWGGEGSGATAATASPYSFCGLSIALAALRALVALPGRESLGLADQVILVGPSGLGANLDALLAVIGTPSPTKLTFVCDGCTLLGQSLPPPPPPPPGSPPPPAPCSMDSNCPPPLALPQATLLWGSKAPWRAFTLEGTLATFASKYPTVPLLVTGQGGDARALESYGAWGGQAQREWGGGGWKDTVFIPALRQALAGGNASSGGGGGLAPVLTRKGSGVFFSHGCVWPPTLTLSPATFYHQVSGGCGDGAGRVHNDTLSQVLPALFDCAQEGTPEEFCVSCPLSGGEGSGGEVCVCT